LKMTTFITTLLPVLAYIALLAFHNVNYQDLSETNRGPVGQTGLTLWYAPRNPEICTPPGLLLDTFDTTCHCKGMHCVGWQGPNPSNPSSWWQTPHAGIDRDYTMHFYNFLVHFEVRINQFFVDSCVLTGMMSMTDKLQDGKFMSCVGNIFAMCFLYNGMHFVPACITNNPVIAWVVNYVMQEVILYFFTPCVCSIAMLFYMYKNEKAFKAYVVMLFWQFVQVVCARIMIILGVGVESDLIRLKFLNYVCTCWIIFVYAFCLDYFYEMAKTLVTFWKQRGCLLYICLLVVGFLLYESNLNHGMTLKQIESKTGGTGLEYFPCAWNPVTLASQAAVWDLIRGKQQLKNICTGWLGNTFKSECTIPVGCDSEQLVVRGWYSSNNHWNLSVKNPMHNNLHYQMLIYAIGFFFMCLNGEGEWVTESKVELFEFFLWCGASGAKEKDKSKATKKKADGKPIDQGRLDKRKLSALCKENGIKVICDKVSAKDMVQMLKQNGVTHYS